MDRKAFFDSVRRSLFAGSISQSQVQGIEAILDEAERRGTPRNFLAYDLATVFHETAQTMQPIHERGKVAYFDRYEPGTRVGRMLGNTLRGDGYRFRGRGLVQLTGRRNYALASRKLDVDLLANPDYAILPQYAVPILFDGMGEGWFTGKDEHDYIDELDEDDKEDLREFINARRIVNGTDKAATIGGYALKFEAALKAAGYPVTSARPQTHDQPVLPPPPEQRPPTLPSRQPDDPGASPQAASPGGFFDALAKVFAAIAAIFKKGA